MRHRWTNWILHTTAKIQQKKQALLTDHAFKSALDVFSIVFLELFLLILSLPLYLVTQPNTGGGEEQVQFKIRRVLSLSVLTVLLILWLFKLLFIVYLSFFSPSSSYSISDLEASEESTLELTQLHAESWTESPEVETPMLEQVVSDDGGNIFFTGKAEPNSVVAIYLSSSNFDVSSLKVYSSRSDEAGIWNMGHEHRVFHLSPGTYSVEMVTYDEALQAKSPLSAVVSFNVEIPQDEVLFEKIDSVLNITTFLFVLIGVLSALLTL